MQLIAYDYVRDRRTGGDSLARLSALIHAARREADEAGAICVLVDNGDTLQGTPLGSHLARNAVTPHPMIAAMNRLGYDAMGLGNHDFDHGMDHLAQAVTAFDAPVICSNLTSDHLPGLAHHCVLDRTVTLPSGGRSTLRLGIISVLPEQTASWNRHHLDGSADVGPPLIALEDAAAHARSDGADVVIALAHMGIAQFDEGADAQNRVADVAALHFVDAVIAGHTHLRFPGRDHAEAPGIDPVRGLIHGKPVVMPGSAASDLGVIDMTLERAEDTAGWRVTQNTVALRKPAPGSAEDPEITGLAQTGHDATRAHLAHPVARLAAPIHSYFALVCPCPVTALMAAAKSAAVARAVTGTDLADLPLLAATATPATGGFDGPENFVALPAGQLERRHLAGLIPYANHVWAVRATGARIASWLERSSLIFEVLQPGQPDQMLINPQVPGFRYDTIYGLTYRIDLTTPARYDIAGRPVEGAAGRVSDIAWQGRPVHPEQEFLVAVTDHRAGGGGTFRPFEDADIVLRGDAPVEQALIDYLAVTEGPISAAQIPWCFAPAPGVSAILNTAPEALGKLEDIAGFRPDPCGLNTDGFARLRLHF